VFPPYAEVFSASALEFWRFDGVGIYRFLRKTMLRYLKSHDDALSE
jgi:hypothetical protein